MIPIYFMLLWELELCSLCFSEYNVAIIMVCISLFVLSCDCEVPLDLLQLLLFICRTVHYDLVILT